MRSITDLFIRLPVLAIVVNAAIVLIGLRAMFLLPIQQYPKLESTSIVITTYYIGASAETIRGFLTTPIEQAVSSIAGIDYIESSSSAGASVITVRLKLNHDSTQALAEVNARLQQVRRQLPPKRNHRSSSCNGPIALRLVLHQFHIRDFVHFFIN